MAYYSKLRPKVYHECSNCNVGNNMVKGNLKTGTPPIVKRGKKLKLCKMCAQLQAELKCNPGVPELPDIGPGDTVNTYYSKENPEIFHLCENCFLGQNIEADNLVANQPPLDMGRKKTRLCKICVRLCISGKCITGTPIPANS